MKVKYLHSMILVILLSFSSCPLVALNPTDTIQSIPFVETWDSATFTANAWRFPYTQGNWAIVINAGNPSPCATFSGLPSTSNYINALVSPWFDARGLTCDDIGLDFDLKLISLDNTGTEKLSLILENDSTSYTMMTWKNTAGFDWKQIHYDVNVFHNQLFRVRFVAFGQYSDLITGWFLDNIKITRQCRPAQNLIHFHTGECLFGHLSCFIHLTWEPPICNGVPYNTLFQFDDGSWENAWAISLHTLGWLGNEFPVNAAYQGVITSIRVSFYIAGPPSPDSLTIDIFDGNRNLVGSSQPFVPYPYGNWQDIPVPNIPFSGEFYAMVKWNMVNIQPGYLYYDDNGPYSQDDLEWVYNGTDWMKIWTGGPPYPSVTSIRALATLTNQKKVMILPGQDPVLSSSESGLQRNSDQVGYKSGMVHLKTDPDSSQVTGYLVYGHRIYLDTGFILRTPVPISGYSYTDSILCWSYFYIRAVYADGCISEPSDTVDGSCYTGLVENKTKNYITIAPSFASDFTEVSSETEIRKIDLIDLNGTLIKSFPCERSNNIRIEVGDLRPGIYFVSVELEGGVIVKKLVVTH